MPKTTGTKQHKSRKFCQLMVDAGDKVWRKEDIDAASAKSSTNPGWGPGGDNRYDIWLYKGGGSCQHFWERRTYLKKGNKRISVNRAKQIIREAGPDAERLQTNPREVAQRPRDMVGRGFLDGRGNWTTER